MQECSPDRLFAAQQAGHALQGGFYSDREIYARELQRIFFRSWLYAGHLSQLPREGDYLVFAIAGESVIVTRSAPDTIRAHLNVCRHRGSRICLESQGNEKLFVCRYHGWTYNLDGSLRGAAHLPPEADKSALGLKPLHVVVFHGMIFINFAQRPAPFDAVSNDLDQALRPYGLAGAKVAARRNYPIAANWKLAVENYCECYHCIAAHPEFSEAHGRALPDQQVAALLDEVMARAPACGLTQHKLRRSWLAAGSVGIDRGFERYPLLHGFVTGSRDGKPLAPLLGSIRGYDGGTTDIHIGPVTFFLAYCDHVVVYRFTPRAIDSCDCEITWLVNGSAVEDRDYDVDRLTWLWQVTTEADKRIIEHAAAGVASHWYEPGPLTAMEDFTRRFVDWYLATMR
jgi:Rieske 2Fe-2S family protein